MTWPEVFRGPGSYFMAPGPYRPRRPLAAALRTRSRRALAGSRHTKRLAAAERYRIGRRVTEQCDRPPSSLTLPPGWVEIGWTTDPGEEWPVVLTAAGR